MNDPWFRMHANIGSRRVTWRLMEHAHIDKARAVGHLAMFWGSLSQHCPLGDISQVPDAQIEEWAAWTGRRGLFASFVHEKHSTEGVVNEYEEYSGKLEERRERDRKRKAADKVARTVDGIPQEDESESERNSAGIPAESERNSRRTKRNETRTTEKPKGRRENAAPWMGEVRAVLTKHYGTKGAPGKYWTQALTPPVLEHGIRAVVLEMDAYCARTKPDYLNPVKFAEMFGTWTRTPVQGSGNPETERSARHLWDLCKRYGFHHCTRSTIDSELARAHDAGDVGDPEAFKSVLRKLDLYVLKNGQNEEKIVASIAERLAA